MVRGDDAGVRAAQSRASTSTCSRSPGRRAREAAHRLRRRRHAGRRADGQHLDSGVRVARRLAPLDERVAALARSRSAITSPASGTPTSSTAKLYGIPWYVDTRVLFYRTDLLAEAGFRSRRAAGPSGWRRWRRIKPRAARALRHPPADRRVEQPVMFGLRAGAALLRDGGRVAHFRDPRVPPGRSASTSTSTAAAWRRRSTNSQVANLYQQFAAGRFRHVDHRPVEPRRVHAPAAAGDAGQVGHGADAGARRVRSRPASRMAGGASLVLFRARSTGGGVEVVEFLSEPAQQVRFYELTGDLPARRSAWNAPALAGDPYVPAFRAAARARAAAAAGAGVGGDRHRDRRSRRGRRARRRRTSPSALTQSRARRRMSLAWRRGAGYVCPR